FDPELQVGLLAHELAVVVQVVVGVPLPERVVPDAQRLLESVHVLGHAEQLDAALGSSLAVALCVRGREVLRGRALLPVGAEVHVEVGQHLALSSASASSKSTGRVTFRLSAGASTTRTEPPAASTSEASSVAAASTWSGTSRARRSTSARKTCGVWMAHS